MNLKYLIETEVKQQNNCIQLDAPDGFDLYQIQNVVIAIVCYFKDAYNVSYPILLYYTSIFCNSYPFPLRISNEGPIYGTILS